MTELDEIREHLNAVPPERLEDVRAFIDYLSKRPSGNIIAVNVPLEEYMQHYAEQHCEWVEGFVIKMSPSELRHIKLVQYLYRLLEFYFAFRPIGKILTQPFVLRLPEFPKRCREPDLMIVLNSNPNKLKNTYMDGAPDICVEVVSEESHERAKGEKFKEYEKGGVPEYWILDPIRSESHFYRLSSEKRYQTQPVDADSNYQTPILPRFKIHVPTLWLDPLPLPTATRAAIQAMLNGE